MQVGVMVFSRMSSSRVPGKALVPLGDRPLLGRVLDRARRIANATEVVVATSTDPSDEPLVEFVRAEGLGAFRGSLEDVAGRAVACATSRGWEAFVRICGDRPFLDPAAADLAIERMAQGPDLVTNLLGGPVAPGLTVEVVRTEALSRVLEVSSDPLDREHLTRHFYAHPERFRLVDAGTRPEGAEGLHFAVDTPTDVERARWVIERLSEPTTASLAEIVQVMRSWQAPIAH